MTNSIQELKKMILNPDIKVSVVLQHALVVASEHDKNFVSWIKQEMDGYTSEENFPKYRTVHGTPKAMNEYGAWVQYLIPDSKSRNAISGMRLAQSASSLENCVSKPGSILQFSYSSNMQDRLSRTAEGAVRFTLEVQSHAIASVLDKIRNELLNWIIDLSKKEPPNSDTTPPKIIFSKNLISRLPKDLKVLANDFNFNFSHDKADACMLILRRMLPLSIVRKFQQDNQEKVIKKDNGEHLDTMPLLAKAKHLISERRYKEIISYKKILDASQHSYSVNIDTSDVLNVAIALRMLFDEFFPDKDNKNQ